MISRRHLKFLLILGGKMKKIVNVKVSGETTYGYAGSVGSGRGSRKSAAADDVEQSNSVNIMSKADMVLGMPAVQTGYQMTRQQGKPFSLMNKKHKKIIATVGTVVMLTGIPALTGCKQPIDPEVTEEKKPSDEQKTPQEIHLENKAEFIGFCHEFGCTGTYWLYGVDTGKLYDLDGNMEDGSRWYDLDGWDYEEKVHKSGWDINKKWAETGEDYNPDGVNFYGINDKGVSVKTTPSTAHKKSKIN